MKEDASILCDSEFRAQALVRQSDERLGGQANEKYLHQDHPTTGWNLCLKEKLLIICRPELSCITQ